jgi:ATP-binding cassette subfamily G (WHITE) protein 2 (PDR)
MEVSASPDSSRQGIDDHRNLSIIFSMLLILLMVHLIATEYIPAQQSRGEILVYRKGKKERLIKVNDEESGNQNQSMYSPDGEKGHMHFTVTGGVEQRREQEVFHWSNVNYSIKSKNETRNILTDIEGWVQPGTLTVLMVSGGAAHSRKNTSRSHTPPGRYRRWQDEPLGYSGRTY